MLVIWCMLVSMLLRLLIFRFGRFRELVVILLLDR